MANASVRTKKIVKKKTNVETVKARQTASTFGVIKNTIKAAQVFCGCYSFFNILFWLAYTAKIVGQSGIYYIFKPAWSIVNIFYTYKPTDSKDDIDFTGVVCSMCIMIIAIILKSVSDYVAEMEENAKIEDAKRLERAKKRALAQSKGKVRANNMAKNKESGFIFLLDISIKQVSGFIQSDVLTPEEVAKIKTQFFKTLLNNLNLNQVVQKGYYKKKLFLSYKNISYFDDFIYYTRDTLVSLAKEFTKPNIRMDFLVGLNVMGLTDDLKEKLEVLDTINKLNLKNEFICTQPLKEIYECNKRQTYKMVSKGVYNLSKNLNISNNQEIYSLRED